MGLLRWMMLVLLAGMLLSCNTNGGSGTGGGLLLSANVTGIKSITFTWPKVSGATHYKLFVNPDGASGFTQVGSDIVTTSSAVSIPVHLTQWLKVRYLVEAHDAGGVIATSPSIGISSLMLDTIGYAKASNTGIGDYFGYRVAVSGDGNTMAVSAIYEDSSAVGINGSQTDRSVTDSGAVYLFVRSGETWVQQAYIKASNTDAFDAFGSSLALSSDGNTLAVGAIGEDSNATGINGNQTAGLAVDSGAVYLFIRTGATWSQQAYIKASNTDSGDAFGSSVALSSDGNTLAVGARGEDSSATGINGDQLTDAALNSGAVYLFTRNVAIWTQQAYIKASNTGAADAFGSSLALSSDGNTLAVGAAGEDSSAVGINSDPNVGAATDAGAAYVFARSGTTWSQQAYVKASNTDALDNFGGSVSLSGDGNTLAIGAIGEDSASTGINGDQFADTAGSSGAVYLFTRSGIVWSQQAYVKATNTGALDNFGISVALSGGAGNTLAVGAHQEDSNAIGMNGDQLDNTFTNSGAVYLYTRTAGLWSAYSYTKAPNTDAYDNFGAAISMSNDGNTLVIGATGEDSSATGINGDMLNNDWASAGAAYLY